MPPNATAQLIVVKSPMTTNNEPYDNSIIMPPANDRLLHLLENPVKIKPEYLHTEYIHDYNLPTMSLRGSGGGGVEIWYTPLPTGPKIIPIPGDDRSEVIRTIKDGYRKESPTPKVDDNYVRQEIMLKYRKLKERYPSFDIPTYDNQSNIHIMKHAYELTANSLENEHRVKILKELLSFGFISFEAIVTNLGLSSMKGFSTSQSVALDANYTVYLVEIADKYSLPSLKIPVELKLLAAILFNAGIYSLSKRNMTSNQGNGSRDMFLSKARLT
jgi:hypothetical protein